MSYWDKLSRFRFTVSKAFLAHFAKMVCPVSAIFSCRELTRSHLRQFFARGEGNDNLLTCGFLS